MRGQRRRAFRAAGWILLLILALSAGPGAAGTDGAFPRVREYVPGQFSDVGPDCWCADAVRAVWETGIMSGRTGSVFDTEGVLTVGQALAVACRLHSGYGGETLELAASNPWYQAYVEYAWANGVIQGVYEDYYAPISRAGFAVLLDAALPEEALPPVNPVDEGAVPDVPADAACHDAVYRLYRAGVLTGSGPDSAFHPWERISRGAAAAVAGRMADPALRRVFTLTLPVPEPEPVAAEPEPAVVEPEPVIVEPEPAVVEPEPFVPTPPERLANLTSLRKNLTDAELRAAYQAALELVRPYGGLSRAEQLQGVSLELRHIFDGGMSFSASAPHCADAYGFLVARMTSPAGCARATGLCLNILGIPYEHVHEDSAAGHQWCRVPVGDGYWICDAYGLYCGPEPSPFTHPYLN